jgi:formylglycine-generating enzyme required for sulfatase activity
MSGKHALGLAAVALLMQAQHAVADDALDARIAELKAKTAALVAADRPRLEAMSPQQRLAAAPVIWRVPGAISEFQDCAACPTMVVIPAGDYTMGSPPAEQGAEAQHRVTLAAPFAVGRFEVTFEQWDACVADGGCGGFSPEDQGWGRGKRPVINMKFGDAQAYAAWLAHKTGKPYRLLTEAEWEFAARAGTTTVYGFGDSIDATQANHDGSTDGSGPSEVNRQQTLPVGSFPANAFGVHDMHGNASEWVEDCWHDDYTAKAPVDGSAWLDGNCDGRVVRGGSWEDSAAELRSAARTGEFKDNSSYADGFRVARGL